MTFGYSRDDVGKFLPVYLSKGILQNDPFEVSPLHVVPSVIRMQWLVVRPSRVLMVPRVLVSGARPEGRWPARQDGNRERSCC